jgi:hypothetical protein
LVADDWKRAAGAFAKAREASELRVAFVFFVLVLAGLAVFAAMLLSGTATAIGALALIFVAIAAKQFFDDRLATATRWGKGGNAEAAVGALLESLLSEGFTVLHDLEHVVPGNVDHVVRAPTGAMYMVETKFRSYRDNDIPKAKRDAATLAATAGVRLVQPVICLATRSYGPCHVRGVVVVGRGQLLPYLRSQGS